MLPYGKGSYLLRMLKVPRSNVTFTDFYLLCPKESLWMIHGPWHEFNSLRFVLFVARRGLPPMSRHFFPFGFDLFCFFFVIILSPRYWLLCLPGYPPPRRRRLGLTLDVQPLFKDVLHRRFDYRLPLPPQFVRFSSLYYKVRFLCRTRFKDSGLPHVGYPLWLSVRHVDV